uniref:DUF4228 domain-containing protein n=1 Tax=Oryza barthii TaxID=65489 RepID=A0A0D3GF29_9ORYZ
MAQLAAPASTVRDAGPSTCFVCCSDELHFDASARAMAAHDALRPGQLYFVLPPGQLYFVLPVSALRRPLSGHDMAALAVKASAALSSIGVPTSSATRRKDDRDGAAASGKRRRTSRVAPLAVVSGIDAHATPLMAKTRKCGRRRACITSLLQRITTPMGSCVSRSTAAAASAITTTTAAKVVFRDGSMAQFAAPGSTVRDALGGECASSSASTCFVCCSDELHFDAPPPAAVEAAACRRGARTRVPPASSGSRRRLEWRRYDEDQRRYEQFHLKKKTIWHAAKNQYKNCLNILYKYGLLYLQMWEHLIN